MLSDPAGTMSTFRALGVRMVRIIVVWAQIAPQAQSRTAPRGFDASDPAAYPAANWAPYDAMIKVAHADGIGVDLTLSGGAPRWAEGPGIPSAALDNQFWAWRPSAQAFGQFARAAAERYSGTYVPPGQTAPLPRVSFWAIWNEPNFGEDLGPQAVNGSTVSVAPGMYRSAGEPDVERAPGDRARARHDPDRRVRAARPERPRRPRPSAGAARELRADQAAAVPAHAVLRGLGLPGAARTRGPGGRMPVDGRGIAQLPQAESGAVQRHRLRGPSVPGQRAPDDRDLDRSRHRAVPAAAEPRARARPRCSGSTARASASRSTTPSTATSPTRPNHDALRLAGDRRLRTSTGPST